MELRSSKRKATTVAAAKPEPEEPVTKMAATKKKTDTKASTSKVAKATFADESSSKNEDAPEEAEPAPAEKEPEVSVASKEDGKEEAVPAAPEQKQTLPEADGIMSFDDFGGEVQFNDGTATTLKALVEESKAGVVIFTYPKASTPGCTRQACVFRDNYSGITSTGFAVYGLSTDSPSANTKFQEKQKLPFPLLCDPKATLLEALGFKKAPKGTTRGVFLVKKDGHVGIREAGGPEATHKVVKELLEAWGKDGKLK